MHQHQSYSLALSHWRELVYVSMLSASTMLLTGGGWHKPSSCNRLQSVWDILLRSSVCQYCQVDFSQSVHHLWKQFRRFGRAGDAGNMQPGEAAPPTQRLQLKAGAGVLAAKNACVPHCTHDISEPGGRRGHLIRYPSRLSGKGFCSFNLQCSLLSACKAQLNLRHLTAK